MIFGIKDKSIILTYDVIIVQQYVLFLSQLKVRDNNIFVNYTCKKNIIFIIIIFTFDISVPLTSEMIATPLPCNITEYKTLAIWRVIFIWASNILWLDVNSIR